jgi:nitrogen fixation/metabolism regulation signal transduction histidine kinase
VEDPLPGESDLGFALLLATVMGVGAAVALAGLAARSLARPVGALRDAAAAVGRGDAPPALAGAVPEEFASVADAFGRMARDVRSSRSAVEAAQQRLAAVLRNVATGVVGLSRTLAVSVANPRAEQLLGAALPSETRVREVTAADWGAVWDWIDALLQAGTELAAREFTIVGRRVRVQVSTLGAEAGGCVVAVDDVTELAHAVRVIAWGELARQVAHEIKNPLTPLRLGIQHLQRAYRGPSADFEGVLQRTGAQILGEIDRLDAVARAFARFGTPLTEQQAGPLEAVDVAAVAGETVALYTLSGDTRITLSHDGLLLAQARRDELKEVLLNLVENARNARAARVELSLRRAGGWVVLLVTDDGRGVAAQDLPRIFEPHFSTTTSGTGLGLAICKRLVESWGARISVTSTEGKGATVRVEMVEAEGRAGGGSEGGVHGG